MTDSFWDDMAPYGANGYAHGRGEFVPDWRPVREVSVRMREGTDVLSRMGVAELADGRVYHFAYRIAEHWQGRPLKVAHPVRESFPDAARRMLENETAIGRADPASLAVLREQVGAL